MAEYFTNYNGKFTTVYDFDKCIRALQCRNEDNENRIKYVEEENRKLREEYNKDEEIQKMQAEVKKMQKSIWRGFPISEEEEKAINEWKRKHEIEVHGLVTDEQRMRAHGCCGGSYRYVFLPTSIGISGTIKCHCGAEFEFQEIS